MPLPIICAHEALCPFADAFAAGFSKPQRKYLVSVLLALLLCQERRTLSALLRRILEARSLSGLSRCFVRAPWSEQKVAHTWRKRFDAPVCPLGIAAHQRHEATRPQRPGRPKATVVTGYLLRDDSTHPKPKAGKMAGCSLGTVRRQCDKEHQSRLLDWLRQGFQDGSGTTEMGERLAA